MENFKENIIKNIITDIAPEVSCEQLKHIESVISRAFYNFDILPKETGLTLYDDSNERMLKVFAANKKLENLSHKSIIQYVHYNRHFMEDIGKPYNQVTTEDAKVWLAKYMTRVSPNTVVNARRYLSSFFTWLHDNAYVDRNIIKPIKNIRGKEPKKEHLTSEEIEAMRDNCKGKREMALIDFLLSTGVRVGELTELKIADVDFIRGNITLMTEKSHGKYRTVYLDAKAKKYLVDYLQTRTDDSPYLFVHSRCNKTVGLPLPLQKGGVERILKNIAKRAGVNKHCTVHIFRRTLATMLHRRGVKLEHIKEILGHANTAITESHYVSVCREDTEHDFRRAVAA